MVNLNKAVQSLVISVGKLRIEVDDLKLSLDGKELKGVAKFLAKVLGEKNV